MTTSKAPFRRGARLTNGRLSYKVSKCEARGCVHCEGSGLLWTITLRGHTGLFETQLDSLRKGGYVVAEKKRADDVEENE
jgi:hypothetical protein